MIYRNWEHYWQNGNHGFTSSSKDLAKEIWDDFEETINATHDDYKKAYIQLCEEKTKIKSEMQDAMLAYINEFVPKTAPRFWKWWLDQPVEETLETPHIVAMVGIPCSGKTTYRKEHYPGYTIISWDDIVQEMNPNKTYNEAFKLANFKDVERIYRDRLQDALESNKNIVVDMTLVSRKSRSKRLSGVPNHYKKTAVVCQTSEQKFHERNAKRSREGKTIPDAVYQLMKTKFQIPTEAEGFDEVIRNLT